MNLRMLLTGVLTAAVGFVAGSLVAYARFEARSVGTGETQDAEANNLTRLAAERDEALARADDLEAQRRELQDELRDLHEEFAALEEQIDQEPVGSFASMAEAAGATFQARDAAPEPGGGGSEGRRRRGPWRGDENLSEEERAERRAQWEAFREQWRTQQEAAFQAELDAAPDAATVERLQAIREYTDYMREAWQAMSEAEDEEERQTLREDMANSGRTLGELWREQQDAKLRQLATAHGITDPGKQDAFVAAMRDLQSDPFYTGFGGPMGGPMGPMGPVRPGRGGRGGGP